MPEERPDTFEEKVRLVELVDRVLDRGVMLRGQVTISVAGIDLVHLELSLLLTGVEALIERHLPGTPPSAPQERGRLRPIESRPPPDIQARPPPGAAQEEEGEA